MNVSFLYLLKAYVNGTVALSDIRDWLAINQWDDAQESELIDSVDSVLAQLDDKYITEQEFRNHLTLLLAQQPAHNP